MRVQIIYETSIQVRDLIWVVDLFNTTSSVYGMEHINLTCGHSIDSSCDVIFRVLNSQIVQIGILNDHNFKASSNSQYHWIEIEFIVKGQIDELLQLILVTIGMQYIPSVTGGFSADWEDLKTVLKRGGKGYCCAVEWRDTKRVIKELNSIQNESRLRKILSCSALLNQDLGLNERFRNLENIVNGIHHSDDFLSVVNIADIKVLPLLNFLLFISGEFSFEHSEHLIRH